MSRNKYPERTVQKILEEAAKLFMDKGYDKTSIDDIARASGVTKGAIYHHFSSKENLLSKMIVSYDYNGDWILEIQQNATLTGLEKLKALFAHELGNKEKIKTDAVFQKGLQDPKIITHQLHASIDTIAPLLESFIREGIEDGSIITEQPKQVAEVMIILINIWINPGLFPVSEEEVIEKAKFLNYLLMKLGINLFDENLETVIKNYLDALER